jgi:hypothetical protein
MIPEGVSFDEAATCPIAYQTATLGLYQTLKLPEPYSMPDKEATPILVWGGASRYFHNVRGSQLLTRYYTRLGWNGSHSTGKALWTHCHHNSFP